MVPTAESGEPQFRKMVQTYQTLYQKPQKIFMWSSLFLFLQLYAYTYVVYGAGVFAIAFVVFLAFAVWILAIFYGAATR